MWLAGATDTLEWVCLFWAWVTDSNCERRLGDKTVRRLPKAFSTVRDDALNDPNESTCQTKELIGRMGPKEAFLAKLWEPCETWGTLWGKVVGTLWNKVVGSLWNKIVGTS